MTSEADLQVQVADYLRLQYPNVMFHSDFGSGIKLTMGQAIKQKRQNGGRKSWPDMFLAEPIVRDSETGQFYKGNYYPAKQVYNGLFIELKRQGTRIYKKDGTLTANEHIQEQAKMLEELRKRGYMAEFACGFDEAKEIIDMYLEGK